MTRCAYVAATLPPLCLALAFCSAAADSNRGAAGSGPASSGGGFTPLDGGSAGAGGADFDAHVPEGGNMCPGNVQSFIWISNTGEGTLSKVCTVNAQEVARYFTSPQQADGDPSRTSVNLHGDMVVTNRSPKTGTSSVTKFAGDIKDCVDRNDNGVIDTSFGPAEVKPWGEDECMLWNTPLGGGDIGARATAWDGKEDPETGLGGHVYIGAMMNRTVYQLDGDSGQILGQAVTALGHYGGAIDNKGNFWTVDMNCTVGLCQIERISVDDLNKHETHAVHCGYGISVDAKGRIWNAGMNAFAGGGCVSRFDPATAENVWADTGAMDFDRGVAVGIALSAGSVWAASTNGDLIQVDMETVKVVKRQHIGAEAMVGVAVDYQGFVWTVSQGGNAAHKVHPVSWEITTVPIGKEPYTYSDMTGMQLWGVINPPN
ncbi:MAG: hypothetical protein HY744_07570 [Deltaproteobacteria bacterium]|nr:hypothetical protein [Deltaproteobacteria bacterium]